MMRCTSSIRAHDRTFSDRCDPSPSNLSDFTLLLPGILAIIPIVNMFILVKIAGYSAWLGLLYFIPIANVVLAIIVAIKVGERFGKGGAFSFFLLFLFPFIGYLILGFGDARYAKRA